MAYFRCVGGVGGGAVLTLTYSSEFYGETITATDGTKTVTKVAPSTGTMDITLPESGTWVVSATIDGQTYSTTVTVNLGYTASLEAIPDGSTVTPTDDIQTWLKCAGIRDKTTYTTLSDVLSDTDTLIALCADSNACDYMARSTNWASGVTADSTAMLIVGKYNYCANALLGNSTWASAIANSTYSSYVDPVPVTWSNTLIHSAVEDSIFYMDEGTPVALCTIPSGDTEDVDMESFKGQTLTLVSTVAKDPTNLSNDFSMNVRITPNITEIYLMPVKELYWYGHECEVLTGGNNFAGWTSNYPGVGVSNGTAYTNHYDTSESNGLMHGYGTVNKIYITDSDYVKCIVSYTNATSYKFLQANPDKKTTSVLDGNNPAPAPIIKIYSEGVASLDVSSYTGNYGIAAYTYHNVGMNVHAIWLE